MYSLRIVLFCVFIVKFTSACGSLNHILFGEKYEFVDLTFPSDNTTIYFHTEKNENSENETTIQNHYMHDTLMLGGTHIEAPYAYEEKGANISDIANKKLIVQLIVIDISGKVKDDSKYVLRMSDVNSAVDDTVKHMEMWPTLLVFKFGWYKYYHEEKYLGHNHENHEYIFPVISKEVAEWLTTNETCRHVVGIGVDLANVERSSSEGFPVHKTLAKAGLYIIENLNLTSNLPVHKCTAVALPLKEKERARAPINVVAICPNESHHEKHIDKRDNHEPEHTSHSKHKCMKHHIKEVHEFHDLHGKEHDHNKIAENNNNESSTDISTEPPKKETESNIKEPSTESPKKEPETGSNNKEPSGIKNNKEQNSGSNNNNEQNPVKVPQKIIESVFKFKDMLNKDKPQH